MSAEDDLVDLTGGSPAPVAVESEAAAEAQDFNSLEGIRLAMANLIQLTNEQTAASTEHPEYALAKKLLLELRTDHLKQLHVNTTTDEWKSVRVELYNARQTVRALKSSKKGGGEITGADTFKVRFAALSNVKEMVDWIIKAAEGADTAFHTANHADATEVQMETAVDDDPESSEIVGGGQAGGAPQSRVKSDLATRNTALFGHATRAEFTEDSFKDAEVLQSEILDGLGEISTNHFTEFDDERQRWEARIEATRKDGKDEPFQRAYEKMKQHAKQTTRLGKDPLGFWKSVPTKFKKLKSVAAKHEEERKQRIKDFEESLDVLDAYEGVRPQYDEEMISRSPSAEPRKRKRVPRRGDRVSAVSSRRQERGLSAPFDPARMYKKFEDVDESGERVGFGGTHDMLGTVTEDEFGTTGAKHGDVGSWIDVKQTYENILKEMQSFGSKGFRIRTKDDGSDHHLKLWGPAARKVGDKTTSKKKENNPWNWYDPYTNLFRTVRGQSKPGQAGEMHKEVLEGPLIQMYKKYQKTNLKAPLLHTLVVRKKPTRIEQQHGQQYSEISDRKLELLEGMLDDVTGYGSYRWSGADKKNNMTREGTDHTKMSRMRAYVQAFGSPEEAARATSGHPNKFEARELHGINMGNAKIMNKLFRHLDHVTGAKKPRASRGIKKLLNYRGTPAPPERVVMDLTLPDAPTPAPIAPPSLEAAPLSEPVFENEEADDSGVVYTKTKHTKGAPRKKVPPPARVPPVSAPVPVSRSTSPPPARVPPRPARVPPVSAPARPAKRRRTEPAQPEEKDSEPQLQGGIHYHKWPVFSPRQFRPRVASLSPPRRRPREVKRENAARGRVHAAAAQRRARQLTMSDRERQQSLIAQPSTRAFTEHTSYNHMIEGDLAPVGRVHLVSLGPDTGDQRDQHILTQLDADSNMGAQNLRERSRRGPFKASSGRSRVMGRSAHVSYRRRGHALEITVRRGVTDSEMSTLIGKLNAHRISSYKSILILISGSRKKLGTLDRIDMEKLREKIYQQLDKRPTIGLLLQDVQTEGVLHKGYSHSMNFAKDAQVLQRLFAK